MSKVIRTKRTRMNEGPMTYKTELTDYWIDSKPKRSDEK